MRELDLKVQCPELLQQVSGFPNDGKGTALPDILEEIDCNQSALRKALGFADGETTLEQSIKTDLEKQFSLSSNIIFSLLDEQAHEVIMSDMSMLWSNRLPSGTKISKAIARRVADGSYIESLGKYLLTVHSDTFLSKLKEELPKYNIDSSMSLMKDPMVFVQNFFSEIAAAQNKIIGFTIDTLMFLRGCNSPNYSSCYKIDREYNSMSALSLGLSGMAGMIYIRDNSSILGRCWVTFDPKFSSFCVLKTYGFLTESAIATVCQWLCTLLNKDTTWYSSNSVVEEDAWGDIEYRLHLDPTMDTCGVYGDPVVKIYTSGISNNKVTVNTTINLVTPRCIICGKRDNNSRIFCGSCRTNVLAKCQVCDRLMFKDTQHSVQICSSCLSKKEICPICGAIKNKGEECKCEGKKSSCAFCGNEATIKVNNIAICADCAQAMMKDTCDLCGSHGVMYPLGKKALCFNCFSHAVQYEFRTEGNEALDTARRNLR